MTGSSVAASFVDAAPSENGGGEGEHLRNPLDEATHLAQEENAKLGPDVVDAAAAKKKAQTKRRGPGGGESHSCSLHASAGSL